MFKLNLFNSLKNKRFLTTETNNIVKNYSNSSLHHLPRASLLAFNIRHNKLFKNRFVKPFDKFNNYEDVVKYIEWSYPETGLTMESHIANIKFLQENVSYRMFNSLLKLYQQRFVMIPNKYEFNRFDKTNLVKPQKLLVSLLFRRYMKPKAFFVKKYFLETENEIKKQYLSKGEKMNENLQNITLKEINKLYSELPKEEKDKYAAEAKQHQEILDKIFQVNVEKEPETFNS